MKDNIYQHLYNGKEKQDDVLGGVNLDWYDNVFNLCTNWNYHTTLHENPAGQACKNYHAWIKCL